MLTSERLREVLDYDPNTGVFAWKVRPSRSRIEPGSPAGYVSQRGYVCVKIDGRHYLAHRLAWLFMHGEWPPRLIDHINGVCSDNRIENLRLATATQNNANSKGYGKSGIKGVTWDNRARKWKSEIRVNGPLVYLGLFDCPAAASFAYQIAADNHHGEFARW